MSKDISQASMDKLFGHFGQRETPEGGREVEIESSSSSEQKKDTDTKPTMKRKDSVCRVCTEMSRELYDRIRTIADVEGLSVRSIIEYALSGCASHYEETHGRIRVRHRKKGNVGDVFK